MLSSSDDTDEMMSIEVAPDSLSLSWSNLSYGVTTKKMFGKTKHKTILNGVSGQVKPGEVLALMGPSGSGKSTLLDVLAGRVSGINGDILVNGTKAELGDIKRNTAYVAQEDYLFPCLTVRESLYFSAMLRLPRGMHKEEKKARVEEVIEELGLVKAADTKVGDENIRGVSGGERRRVSLGMELLTQPALLLLDEPTSGLDSRAATFLVELLKQLAKKGKTIICAIHQPSSYVFNLFDKVCLLSKGNLVYFGSLPGADKFFKQNGLDLPPSTNPADFYIECINHDFSAKDLSSPTSQSVEVLVNAFKDSNYFATIEEEIKEEVRKKEDAPLWEKGEPTVQTSFLTQFWYLLIRTSLSWSRNPLIFSAQLFSYIVMALAVGSVYWDLPLNQDSIQARLAALTVCTSFLIFNSMTSANQVAREMQIFIRERMNGYYNVLPYTLAYTIIGCAFLAVSSIIFTIICYYMIRFNSSSEAVVFFMINLAATLWAAEAIVVFFAALFQSVEASMALVSAYFTLILLCNGFFIRPENLPGVWIWLYYSGFGKYSFESIVVSEFNGLYFPCNYNTTDTNDTATNVTQPCDCYYPDLNHDCIIDGEEIIDFYNYDKVNQWAWIAVMIGMSVAYRILFYLTLRFHVTGKR